MNTAEPTTDTSQSFAIPGLTRAQLLNGVLGVRVRASRGNSNTAVTASLDAVSVRVDYTAPQNQAISVNAVGATTARGADTFTYDQANRIKTATVAGITETYTYDGDGVRFSRQVGAGPVTRYVSDPAAGLPVTLDDGTRKYVWGLGLAYAVYGSAIELYHTDRLGSVRALSDAAGAVTATYRTDEFGLPAATTGTTSQPFTYTGEPRDGTGLTYLRARYYDPSLGRFLSRDTWPGGLTTPQSLDRYTYVENNPATYSDPSGKAGPVAVCLIAPEACVTAGAAVLEFLLYVAAAAAGGAVVGYLASDLQRVEVPGIPARLPPPQVPCLNRGHRRPHSGLSRVSGARRTSPVGCSWYLESGAQSPSTGPIRPSAALANLGPSQVPRLMPLPRRRVGS